MIISTVLIRFTGWTGWDPLASLFIAALIMASVIPLVIDSAKVLCLDVGATKEAEIRSALGEVSEIAQDWSFSLLFSSLASKVSAHTPRPDFGRDAKDL